MRRITEAPGGGSQASPFSIATLHLDGSGRIGICPLPGKGGRLEVDLAVVLRWEPVLVLSMTEISEMEAAGSASLGVRLVSAGIEWVHLPVRDYGGLSGENAAAWPVLSSRLHGHLNHGNGVLVHCNGGQGRSGMIALRLMVERGEDPGAALMRLRTARPGAVETDEQHAWALHSKRSPA